MGSLFLGSIRGEQITTSRTVISGINKFQIEEGIDLLKFIDAIIAG